MFKPEKPRVEKPVDWKRIAALFLPYWKQGLQVLVCVLGTSILGLVPALLVMRILDKALPQHDFKALILYVVIMVGSALLAGLISVYQGYINSLMGESILRDIRTQLITHIQKLPMSFFTSTKTGEIMNRVSNDVDNLEDVVTETLVIITTNLFVLLTTLVTIFLLDWRLAILSVILIPVMVLPLWPVGRKMYLARKNLREKYDELQSAIQETLSISGITLVKAYGKESHERQRFYQIGSDVMTLEIQRAMIGRWFFMVVTAMVTIGPALIWLFGGWLSINGKVTVGLVVTFVTLLGRLYSPASSLTGVRIQIVSALAIFERIFEYLDMQTEEPDNPNAIELGDSTSANTPGTINGSVAFADVSFAYSTGRQALDNITFEVPAGALAAFVGASGAGKTTIMHLVPRFYNPQSGAVLIDGHNLRDVTLESLRKQIGIVTQETYLFHDTIGNNLRYAKPAASQDELIQAAKAANIHDFISSLPDGYDTIAGERGHKLSGGERQRLAIARVLLKNPKILILDEATSSLDSVNEALIQEALIPLMQERTSLVVAHRLSTIVSADIIFVVDKGRIVEQGTHKELLLKNGAYSKLYRAPESGILRN